MLVYASELLTLTRKSRNILFTRERKISGKIFGPTTEEDTWRIRTNWQLQTIYEYWYE